MSNQLWGQPIARIDQERKYLSEMGKSIGDFSSEEEKLVYLTDHVEETNSFFHLAG